MLLFKPKHVPLILDGTKTQTRRNWVDKKTGKLKEKPRCKVGAIHLAKIKMLSREFFAKLKILRVWKEPLGDISHEDALAEGYPSITKYLCAYHEINNINTVEERMEAEKNHTWCIEFKEVKELDEIL